MADADAARAPGTDLRLWPGVVAVVLLWLGRLVVPLLVPEWTPYGMVAAVLLGFAIVLWWLFLSRISRPERWGGIALVVVAMVLTHQLLLHVSIRSGMMGMMFAIHAVPVVATALVLWALAARHLSPTASRAALAAAILATAGVWTLLRTDGVTGDARTQFQWRWVPTAEERLLATTAPEPPPPVAPTATTPAATPSTAPSGTPPAAPAAPPAAPPLRAGPPAEWPGFRGPDRDGVIRNVSIGTDWTTSPPVEVWRHPIGPGWSSFAVQGNRVYTQEQRGEDEIVSCYDLATGTPVWRHRDKARFYESNAGAGPRSTPALAHGRVYALGATGILNALDAQTGAVLWSRNAQANTGAKLPGWGFSGSPLVVDDAVIVATAGTLVAYDAATGATRWVGPKGGGGYSSPHLVTLHGVRQVVLLSNVGATGVSPTDGKQLWRHEVGSGTKIVQPAVTAEGDLLVHEGDSSNLHRLALAPGGGWTATERWTTDALKPYFSDFVVHEGHAYGFDGRLLSAVDLETGVRKWKGGRFGTGQLVLLADQDLLLVVGEDGEVGLVAAKPDQFTELARVPALEGKTWNHPVVVGDMLLVRNGEQMAAFRLPRAAADMVPSGPAAASRD